MDAYTNSATPPLIINTILIKLEKEKSFLVFSGWDAIVGWKSGVKPGLIDYFFLPKKNKLQIFSSNIL
jgi:hypothetical protein